VRNWWRWKWMWVVIRWCDTNLVQFRLFVNGRGFWRMLPWMLVSTWQHWRRGRLVLCCCGHWHTQLLRDRFCLSTVLDTFYANKVLSRIFQFSRSLPDQSSACSLLCDSTDVVVREEAFVNGYVYLFSSVLFYCSCNKDHLITVVLL
jgi:hypothetical protein